MKRFISRSTTCGLGRGFFSSVSTAMLRAEQPERDHGHDGDDDEARDDPAVQRIAGSRLVPSLVESCQPAASVTVTTVGMISTIFGISRVVNSTRAGIESLPMIGPSTKPRKRSMTVQAEPATTCRNSSGQICSRRSRRS